MKSTFLGVMTLVIFATFTSNGQSFSLSDEGIDRHLNITIKGNPQGTHYIRPLVISVNNPQDYRVDLKIENGLMIYPDDENYQPIVVTREEMLTILPGQTIDKEIHGMCTNSRLRAPKQFLTYSPKAVADSNLLYLTRWIEKDSLHTPEAQYSVWALTSERKLAEIVGFDTTAIRNLVHYLADVTDQELPPEPDENDYLRNYYTTTHFKRTMGGEFTGQYYETRSISIAMFDKDDIVVRELYANPELPPGKHKLSFEFDATVYDDDFYFVRVIDNGDVTMNLKVNTLRRPEN